MPDIILALLRIIFIGLVYLFTWQIARAIGSHLGISVKRNRPHGSRVLFVRSDTQQGTEFEVGDVMVLGSVARSRPGAGRPVRFRLPSPPRSERRRPYSA